jgi:hypothetical protein
LVPPSGNTRVFMPLSPNFEDKRSSITSLANFFRLITQFLLYLRMPLTFSLVILAPVPLRQANLSIQPVLPFLPPSSTTHSLRVASTSWLLLALPSHRASSDLQPRHTHSHALYQPTPELNNRPLTSASIDETPNHDDRSKESFYATRMSIHMGRDISQARPNLQPRNPQVYPQHRFPRPMDPAPRPHATATQRPRPHSPRAKRQRSHERTGKQSLRKHGRYAHKSVRPAILL